MGLGMPEVVLILVIALIVFGPRKLPELGKSLGQAMSQFRKASDEFKRTWEQEVELEKVRKPDTPALAGSGYDSNYHGETGETGEPGYGTDSDYQYGYDAASGSPSQDSLSASETAGGAGAAPTAAVAAATATTEKKAEAHWI